MYRYIFHSFIDVCRERERERERKKKVVFITCFRERQLLAGSRLAAAAHKKAKKTAEVHRFLA